VMLGHGGFQVSTIPPRHHFGRHGFPRLSISGSTHDRPQTSISFSNAIEKRLKQPGTEGDSPSVPKLEIKKYFARGDGPSYTSSPEDLGPDVIQ
jgi:hypothetical protein